MQFRVCFFSFLLFGSLLLFSCHGGVAGSLTGKPAGKIRIMTYNTQQFFDATEDGTEFSEFRGKNSKWSADKYSARLDRLREALLLCGSVSGMGPDRSPDIVVLQEIENASVVQALCNRLPQRSRYPYAVFVPPDAGSAFGTAMLSRFPVLSVSVHSVAVPGAVLRPLLEITLNLGDTPFVIFAAHWKSKVGNGDTGVMRQKQESVLADRIHRLKERSPGVPFIACGDFNQSRDAFSLPEDLVDGWDEWFSRCDSGTVPGPRGSYWYKGEWETIDHFLYPSSERNAVFCEGGSSGSMHSLYTVADVRVVAEIPLVTAEAVPARYEVFSGKGYSDHLPLVLELTRKK